MRPLLALLLLIAVALPALADDPPIALAIRDRQFVPREITIPAGKKVELKVRNEQAVPAEFESTSLHRERVVPAGGTVSVFIGPLSAGRYEFFDDFHPETRGFVIVK
jgi:hypothetical protein